MDTLFTIFLIESGFTCIIGLFLAIIAIQNSNYQFVKYYGCYLISQSLPVINGLHTNQQLAEILTKCSWGFVVALLIYAGMDQKNWGKKWISVALACMILVIILVQTNITQYPYEWNLLIKSPTLEIITLIILLIGAILMVDFSMKYIKDAKQINNFYGVLLSALLIIGYTSYLLGAWLSFSLAMIGRLLLNISILGLIYVICILRQSELVKS